MSLYKHVRSLDHAERLLRDQAREVRRLASDDGTAHSSEQRAALRGKGVAYSEAADLLAVLRRKWEAGELDETRTASVGGAS